jgi:hypothetical protein
MSCSHAADEATEAAAPEATEAATAAPTPIAGVPTHGYEPTREGVMVAFAKGWRGNDPARLTISRHTDP